MSSFYSANYLEESMSYIERTARKLYPILEEVKKRMIPEKRNNNPLNMKKGRKVETLESINDENISDENDFVLHSNNEDI